MAGVACLFAALLSAPAPAFDGEPGADPSALAKLTPELVRALDAADGRALIPIIVVMRDQVGRGAIQGASRAPDRAARRAEVTRLLKTLARSTQADLLETLRRHADDGAVRHIRSLWLHNVVGVAVTPEMVAVIAARDDVAGVRLESRLGPADVPADPDAVPPFSAEAVACGVELMDAPRVWDDLNITGRGSVVCVIDTGACIEHPDLENQIWVNDDEIPDNGIDDDDNGFIDDIHGWNFESNDADLTDTARHGTQTAGIVGGDGTGGTKTGMAPDVQLMIAKFFNNFGGEMSVWRSMQYAVDNGADVVMSSAGWPHERDPDRATWRTVCENTIAAGVVVIYAAGTGGNARGPVDNIRTPGDVPSVITVGTTDCEDQIAEYSSRGPVTWQDIPPFRDFPFPPGKRKPTVVAPGVESVSTGAVPCRGYRTAFPGVSMATPHVAGAVALMLEAAPGLSHEEVKQILMNTAVDLGDPGIDNTFGAGRVRAFEAVDEASSGPIPGACCFEDGSCRDLLFADCSDAGGDWHFGEDCDSFDCPQPGACCFDTGECRDMQQPDCLGEGGLWHDGEACDSFDCPQPGACCVDNVTCTLLTERQCQARRGDFRGEGVSCEGACLCDQVRTLKAECNERGGVSVKVKFRDDSRNGETIAVGIGPRRFDVEIRGRTAKLRACCFSEEQQVRLIGLEECVPPKSVTCPPPPPGACCVDDSTCDVLPERECQGVGGDFKGEKTTCRRFTCPCPLIKDLSASCRGRTIKATVNLWNKSRSGETVSMAIDDEPPFDVRIIGKQARVWKCCFEGEHRVSLIDPDGCVEPVSVTCPRG